jgi:hypothetical protein
MTSYSDFLNLISQTPWLNFSNILALLSIISTITVPIVTNIRSKKYKRPTYRTKTISLLKESFEKIKSADILYNGNKINNLSITKIAIWNDGKETINNTDVSETDKFRIEIDKEYKILDYEIVHQKNYANAFRLTKINDNELEINFHYFDY